MSLTNITARYDIVIGLEVHVQVRTRTKMFCACPNRFGEPPNSLVCPVCLGYPGVLPTPNHEAIKRTLRAGLMCGCQLPPLSKFDRKSYFYPDMPKNYQISQYDLPFCLGGGLAIGGAGLDGEVAPHRIALTRIHLEEDVAKSTHFGTCSGIDFNRAGVPLMEIVSEPDLRTPDEAWLYLGALKQLMQYADISDCDMEKGQLRCDVNISLKPAGQREYNPKTEVKNLNSTKAVHRALHYEIARQAELLTGGGTLAQETRGWDDDAGQTYVLRKKESAHDYRYFPEPDLMPISIDAALLDELRAQCPEAPAARRERFQAALGLSAYDAGVLTDDKATADYFEACLAAGGQPKPMANWIMSDLARELAAAGKTIAASPIAPAQLAALVALMDRGTINGKIAKVVFGEMFQTGQDAAAIVQAKGLVQVTDDRALGEFVRQALAASPKAVEQFRAGKETAVQFLMGQVMRLSRGKANPQQVRELLLAALKG